MSRLAATATLISFFLVGSFAHAQTPSGIPSEKSAEAGVDPASPDRAAEAPPAKSSVGVFVGMEWRGTYLAGTAGHGPGVQAGVLLFKRYLKLGLAGFARPGPINPAEYHAAAANGAIYRGQRELSLRSDGALVGLLIAPVFDLPFVPNVSVELPVVLGQGGFGFYLHGDDRVTPDGRKPSAWENELLDGQDSSFGMGLDLGLRFAWKHSDDAWVQPYIAGHYTTVLGYDSYVRGSYSGPSVALGVQFGTF
jgi:hypothetical protein